MRFEKPYPTPWRNAMDGMGIFRHKNAMDQEAINIIKSRLNQPIVLVGLMGAGKSKMGRLLAQALDLSFTDSDDIIVAREGMAVADIFAQKGEAHFRQVERSVITELLSGAPQVIATGGGAVMTPETADLIFTQALALWLRAERDVLLDRVNKTIDKRPLLQNGDPAAILQELIEKRHPVYERAHIHVDSQAVPLEDNLKSVVKTLSDHLS